MKVLHDEFLRVAARFAHEEGTFLLHSAQSSKDRSFLFLFPFDQVMLVCDSGGEIVGRRLQIGRGVRFFACSDPWQALRLEIGEMEKEGEDLPNWVGFLSYEMGAFVEKDRTLPLGKPTFPYAYFQRSLVAIIFDHENSTVEMEIDPEGIEYASAKERLWIAQLQDPKFWRQPSVQYSGPSVQVVGAVESFEAYAAKIEKIKEELIKGEIYQATLSHALHLTGQLDPFWLMSGLIMNHPAPFAAFCRLAQGCIVSASPERLMRKCGVRIESRPIKGTAPRSIGESDLLAKEQLQQNEKERAELLMICDLVRNDFGRIALPGSVQVDELYTLEAYTNVHHMIAQVSAKVDQTHPIDLIRPVFPGGSVTGCPKLHAMELIAKIEHTTRGIYCGSIGYITRRGNFDFNIAIRTLCMQGRRYTLRLGGGIMIDSDPMQEYEETWHKGKPFFQQMQLNPFPSLSMAFA